MTENTHKIFVTTGASNHTETVRASYDLYTTDPKALERFLDVFNLNKNVWECACVDYDTEYFNGKEWVKIGEYKKDDYVLSYIPETNSSMLVIPNEYIKTPYKKDFFVWKSKDLNMTLSENHRVVFLHRRKNTIQVKTAKEVFDIYQNDTNGFRGKIPTTWQDLGGNLIVDEWLLRLAIACNADGRMRSKKKTCLIRVKKERKKERLEFLLKKANISYKYKYLSKNKSYSFLFENPLNNKIFPCEWLNLTRHLKEIFIEEIAYWDGHTSKEGNTFYFSNKKHDIDIVQMIAHSIGINAKVDIDDRTEKRKNTTISYRLSFKRACTNYSLSKSKNNEHLTKEKSKDGYCYCFRVNSSMLILRKNNKIFITGNCGLGHLSEVLKQRDYKVYSTDINNYGYTGQNRTINFLSHEVLPQANEGLLQCDILTNPPYNCFDIDTQCYTKKGWKYYHELNYEDEILSVNPETQQLEWSEIEKIIIRDKEPNEKMYHFKHSHMDIMVTENHRMFVFSKATNNLVKRNDDLLKSEKIRTTHYIPRCGYSWQGEEKQFFVLPAINGKRYAQPVFKDEIKINMDSWLKFFGLWLADGCVRHTKNTQGNYRKTVCIKQLAERKSEIENILNDLPFKYIEREDLYNRKNKTINFVINNEQLWQYLLQFGYSENKFIPEELKEISSRQLKILLDSYFFGDGSYYMEKGRIFRTISKQLAQDIWEILLKLGYLSHITTSSGYTNEKGELKRVYQIIYNPDSMYNRLTFPSNKNDACLTEYSNKVWCVNLKKNGVFLLRRNGFEFVCGNCALEFVKQALNIIEDGYNVVMFLRLQFLEGKARRSFFEKNPPKYVYIFSDRIKCTNQNAPHSLGSSAICYAWFVWQKGFTGDPIIKWL